MKKFFIAIVSICLFLIGCKEKTKTGNNEHPIAKEDSGKVIIPNRDSISDTGNKAHTANGQGSAQTITSYKDSILLKLTQDILTAIKDKNYLAVVNYIDPVSGVRFSPYAYVDTVDNVILSKEKFADQAARPIQNKILWGAFDGNEKPIRMTLNEYMQRFVYDVDFVKPETRRVNKFIKTGNSLNNLLSVYKDCDFTDSHFSGFEEKYEGMDWRTLRLVFKERKGKFFLVGIVHDEWTI
ncbi:MAG TPA: hypothetical protein VGQ04_20015 [Chitinophagaceae bacterium]|jgi:hypothetical protein|nr:hypothetical protein [Chitinophagaceae bacterium]